jgi:hypothetical protein
VVLLAPLTMTKFLACLSSVLALSGCVSAQVQRGALIGAGSGLVLGAGVAELISDKSLLGSSTSKDSGNIALPRGATFASSMLIGTVIGAIVGAMVGHRRDEGYDDVTPPPRPTTPAPASPDGANTAPAKEQARAPYLRGL